MDAFGPFVVATLSYIVVLMLGVAGLLGLTFVTSVLRAISRRRGEQALPEARVRR